MKWNEKNVYVKIAMVSATVIFVSERLQCFKKRNGNIFNMLLFWNMPIFKCADDTAIQHAFKTFK